LNYSSCLPVKPLTPGLELQALTPKSALQYFYFFGFLRMNK